MTDKQLLDFAFYVLWVTNRVAEYGGENPQLVCNQHRDIIVEQYTMGIAISPCAQAVIRAHRRDASHNYAPRLGG